MAAYTGLSASTAAVANRFVTSTNMIVGAYSLANTTPAWQGGCFVTCAHVTATGTDTLGTVVIVGFGLDGQPLTETLTPVADSTVTGTKVFRTISSITGVGWVINGGNDTIQFGVAAGAIVCGSQGKLFALHVNATAAATVVLSDAKRTIATLAASIANGTYLNPGGDGIEFAGFLKVALTSTNDITVVHSNTLPSTIAV